tara:strand:- start:750 stop:962 length:213 start_codon:yes stop_codon:yes gene_type:complete
MSNSEMENLKDSYSDLMDSYHQVQEKNVKLRKKNKDLRKEVKRLKIWGDSTYLSFIDLCKTTEATAAVMR